MDPTGGVPHGKQSPIRWDPSTAASVIVIGALLFLVWVNFSVSTSATISIKK
jgi:hypothetical protein